MRHSLEFNAILGKGVQYNFDACESVRFLCEVAVDPEEYLRHL